MAGICLFALAVHALIYLSTWVAGGAAIWAGGAGAALRVAANAITVAMVLLMLLLPILGRHWPGLLAGRGWLVASLVGWFLLAVGIAFNEMLWTAVAPVPAPGAGAPLARGVHAWLHPVWSSAAELRSDTLLRAMLVMLAMTLLFAGGKVDARATGTDEQPGGEAEPRDQADG